jgi:hypothetical protein
MAWVAFSARVENSLAATYSPPVHMKITPDHMKEAPDIKKMVPDITNGSA